MENPIFLTGGIITRKIFPMTQSVFAWNIIPICHQTIATQPEPL